MLKTLKIDQTLFFFFPASIMFPVTKFRVKRTFMEKFIRKTDFIVKQRVRDKQIRLDRKLKDIWVKFENKVW